MVAPASIFPASGRIGYLLQTSGRFPWRISTFSTEDSDQRQTDMVLCPHLEGCRELGTANGVHWFLILVLYLRSVQFGTWAVQHLQTWETSLAQLPVEYWPLDLQTSEKRETNEDKYQGSAAFRPIQMSMLRHCHPCSASVRHVDLSHKKQRPLNLQFQYLKFHVFFRHVIHLQIAQQTLLSSISSMLKYFVFGKTTNSSDLPWCLEY